jgi:hypothetical protein
LIPGTVSQLLNGVSGRFEAQFTFPERSVSRIPYNFLLLAGF